MKPQSKLDRIRHDLSKADAALQTMLRRRPHYSGILEEDVKRLTRELAHEEERALKAMQADGTQKP